MNGRGVTPAEELDLRVIDDFEARLLDELLSEPAVLEPPPLATASAEPPGRVVTVDDPTMAYAPSAPRPRAPGGLSPRYAGSDNEKRDREAEEALTAAGWRPAP